MNKIKLSLTIIVFLIVNLNLFSQTDDVNIFLRGVKVTGIKNDGVDIWVATEGNGIYKYSKSKNKWTNFSTDTKTIKQNFFYCIEIGPRYVWAGSANGLYIYDKKRRRWTRKKFTLGGQFGNWIRSLKYDKSRNQLWIGRFKYLTKYDIVSRKYKDYNLSVNNNSKTNSVKYLNIDADSVLWIGVEAGLHKFNLDQDTFKTTYFQNKDNFFLNESDQVSITDIIFDNDYIWFGTDEFITPDNPNFNLGGLFRFDRKVEWIKFGEFNGLEGNGIFSLEITGNYIWTSVYKFNSETKNIIGKGIHLINRKTLEIKSVKSDFIPDIVYCLHFDGQNIWLGTNDGLRKISLTNKILPNFS